MCKERLPGGAAINIDPILTSSFVRNFPSTALHLADVGLLNAPSIERMDGKQVFYAA